MRYKHKPFHVAGCGTRRLGKAYLYTYGVRTDKTEDLRDVFEQAAEFIKDPPIPLADTGLTISNQGITVEMVGDTYHAFDWVGMSQGYENAADIIMETIMKDGSSLVPLDNRLRLLQPGESYRLLCHSHGYIYNPEVLKADRMKHPELPECFLPDGDYRQYHLAVNDQMCTGLLWQALVNTKKIDGQKRLVEREVGDLTYKGAALPKGFQPLWGAAIIMAIPIHELHLVVGDTSQNDQDTNDMIQKAMDILGELDLSLPVFLTDN